MSQLVVEGVVVVLLALEGGGCRDADNVILGRIAGGKSRVVDGAEFGILDDGSRLFVKLPKSAKVRLAACQQGNTISKRSSSRRRYITSSPAGCLPLHHGAGVGQAAAENHHQNVIADLEPAHTISFV